MYIKLMCFIYSDYNNIAAVLGVIIGSATDILVMYVYSKSSWSQYRVAEDIAITFLPVNYARG